MSDTSVAEALRSDAPLVVVEAPAGCGKTHQAASYAAGIAPGITPGRVLILAHTHAACDTFAARNPELRTHIDVRTIDSLVVAIASAYPTSVHVSGDVGVWARRQRNGYAILASKVARLLTKCPGIARMLALRYPFVICDEHQDASADQHAIVMSLHEAGAHLRVFGDPMQAVFDDHEDDEAAQRWDDLFASAGCRDVLEYPHRWRVAPELGRWILRAREALRNGRPVDLANRPSAVSLLFADDQSPAKKRYQLTQSDRKPIDQAVKTKSDLLILSARNMTVRALRSFFNRRFPIWEGHVRQSLWKLAEAVVKGENDAVRITNATVKFTESVCTGFSATAFGDVLLSEVQAGCTQSRRGKPGTLQDLGRLLIEEPNHRGVSKFLRHLAHHANENPAFQGIRIDLTREFWDAVALGAYANVEEGMMEIARRRSLKHTGPPLQAISSVHKAKGLECSDVVLMPCDEAHFPNNAMARRLLYVALSRPTKRLTIVVSRSSPSSLVRT